MLIKSYFYMILRVCGCFILFSDILAKRKHPRGVFRNDKYYSMVDVPSVPKILHIYISSKSPPGNVAIHTLSFFILPKS